MDRADGWKGHARQLLNPVVEILYRTGISPDALSYVGLTLSIMAAVAISLGHLLIALFLLLSAGLLDVLDGQLARRTARVSPGGAFLDSNLDRLAEVATYVGLLTLWTLAEVPQWWLLLALLALISSLMVSYVRARGEALGFDAAGGWGQRPERLILFYIALAAGAAGYHGAMAVLVGLIGLLASATFATRFAVVRQQARMMSEGHATSLSDGPPES